MTELKQVSIVPLKGPNYAKWKVQCTMALKKDGVWGIVSDTEEAPASDADPKERERYAVRRDKALATVVLSVDPCLLYLIGDPVDPVAVWKKLEEQFQKKSWINRLNLRRKLHCLRLKDGESVQDHIKTIWRRLTSCQLLVMQSQMKIGLSIYLPACQNRSIHWLLYCNQTLLFQRWRL